MENFSIQWHITDVCNLRCKHCYQDNYSAMKDLDTDKIKLIIDKISSELSSSKISINLTGGEPFLRKDLFDILNYLDRTSNIEDIYIITNGLLINDENAGQIEQIKKIKGVKISLEGSNEAINDSVRGIGTFRKINQAIRILMSTSKPVILMFTLADYNCLDLTCMFEYAKSMGIHAVILERFVPEGQSRSLIKCVLSREEWFKVIRDLINYFDLGLSPQDFLAYRAFWVDFGNNIEIRGALCDHGENSMALMPNGDIYPCRRTPVKIGNIFSDKINDIIDQLKKMRRDYQLKLKGMCRSCEVDECIGCRALARAICNDIYAEDPQCYYNLSQ
ncbi:hypothetical protein A2Y85_00855 [candidate division WOR-3 bacterium RBG_13_43_14]|uniref:Radical SAM core domain-containing protein n=1 Tax=candidate division WOR-3 bacterium RBG_13_43_14 TaxID=1802590 RepID=A0A1F4UDC8_UNCW3|nr:MAG: hypothetical protein A2Y85_00855 [candidate division WOR-3 bacterium RBG_13_43_14]